MTRRRAVTRARDDFDGFTVQIVRDEDGDWLACLTELPSVSAFAETPDRAVDELRQAWEGVKESYRKHNETIPAAAGRNGDKLPLHIPSDRQLHRDLSHEEAQAGISLDALVAEN